MFEFSAGDSLPEDHEKNWVADPSGAVYGVSAPRRASPLHLSLFEQAPMSCPEYT
jgi:hypothetical protein